MITTNSTDQQLGDTSKYTQRVLESGHGTITTSAPGGGATYYYGSLLVDLSAYDFGAAVPEAEVYVRTVAGDGSTSYDKAPYTNVSLIDGTVTQKVGYSLQRGNAKVATYALRLVVNFYSRTNNDVLIVDYQIKSTLAAPF